MNDADYTHVTWRRGWLPALTLLVIIIVSGVARPW